MKPMHPVSRSRICLAACAAGTLLVPWTIGHANKKINERAAADPQGSVEIVDVSGKIDVLGWDRSEIEVSGSVGDGVQRVDVSSSGGRASVHVVARSGMNWGDDGEVKLAIHVPSGSAVTATLVSADLTVSNLSGEATLQTVSGDINGQVGGDLHVHTVSGTVHVAAPAAHRIDARTVSGDIKITGSGGEVEFTTVSGDVKVDLGSVVHGHFESVSGDIDAGFHLAADGQIEGETVSGSVGFDLAGTPAADFDVQSLSGDIDNCFGPKPLESHYGPGSRLQFKNGDSHARVRIETKSGDVRLCAKDLRKEHAATGCPERATRVSLMAARGKVRFLPLL